MEKQEILKLTVPKLRETALAEIKNIAGVHGMNKNQLLEVLFDHFNIPPDEKVKKAADPELKKRIVALRAEKEEANKAGDKKRVDILRRKIHRMKRQTRH